MSGILLGNLLCGIAGVLDFALNVYLYIIIGSAIISWVNADPWNPIVRAIRSATDPLFRRLRRMLPFLSSGGIDFSPLVVLAIIVFLQRFVVVSLDQIGWMMKIGAS